MRKKPRTAPGFVGRIPLYKVRKGNKGNPALDTQKAHARAAAFKKWFEDRQREWCMYDQRIVMRPAIGESAAKNIYSGRLLRLYNTAVQRVQVCKHGVGTVMFMADRDAGDFILTHIRGMNGPVLTRESNAKTLHGWLEGTWLLFHAGTAAHPDFSRYRLYSYDEFKGRLKQRKGRPTQFHIRVPKTLYPSNGAPVGFSLTRHPDIYTALMNAIHGKDHHSLTIL